MCLKEASGFARIKQIIMNNFQPLEIVVRDIETQLQVTENFKIIRVKKHGPGLVFYPDQSNSDSACHMTR